MDDIVLNKVATLERCVARVHEVFAEDERNMVGFRNVAVRDYQALNLDIVLEILRRRLDDLLAFGRVALATEGQSGPARS